MEVSSEETCLLTTQTNTKEMSSYQRRRENTAACEKRALLAVCPHLPSFKVKHRGSPVALGKMNPNYRGRLRETAYISNMREDEKVRHDFLGNMHTT